MWHVRCECWPDVADIWHGCSASGNVLVFCWFSDIVLKVLSRNSKVALNCWMLHSVFGFDMRCASKWFICMLRCGCHYSRDIFHSFSRILILNAKMVYVNRSMCVNMWCVPFQSASLSLCLFYAFVPDIFHSYFYDAQCNWFSTWSKHRAYRFSLDSRRMAILYFVLYTDYRVIFYWRIRAGGGSPAGH